MYKVVLFDLDGTLTESGEEIFENRPYDGVKDLLGFLKKKGYLLAVASSQPECFVKQILDHFEMTEYFTEIIGSEMNGAHVKKTTVIEEALRRIGFLKKREQVLMVGDKEQDILGAKESGIACVAVSYGYGTKEELEDAMPLKIVASVEELLRFFCMSPLRQQKKIIQLWRVISPVLLRLLITEVVGALLLFTLTQMYGSYEDAYYANAVWITGAVGMLAAIPLLFCYKKDVIARKSGGLTDKQERLTIFEMLVLVFMGAALSQVMNMFLGIFSQVLDYQSYSDNMSAMTEEMGLFAQIFWMGILAPFAEEVVFRWLVYLRLQDYYKRGTAMFISGVIFGICHWNLLQAIYASVLGFLFAYLLDICGNLWSCVLLHIGANIWSLVYPVYGTYLLETEQMGILLFILLLLVLILIWGMRLFLEKGKKHSGRCI